MVLEHRHLKSCERIYTIDLSLFLKINSLDMFFFVPNCSLVENILDTFCIAQTWCDHSILRMFTVIKCRGHTDLDLICRERERSMVQILSLLLKRRFFKISKK